MKREIKFRAWDKDRNEMIENAEQGHDFGQYQSFWYFLANPEDRFVLMQYTGLKDKNGKEIFEGDICSISSLYNRLVIDFHDGAFGYWMFGDFVKQSESAAAGGMQNLLSKYEIIGNIHENKNLLSLTNQGAG